MATGAVAVAGFGYYYTINGPSSDKPKQEKSPLDPNQFVNFKLKKIIPYNHNSSTCVTPHFDPLSVLDEVGPRFVFELPQGEASLLPVASCVVVKSADPADLVDDKGKPIIRPYTPTSHPRLPGEIHFLIKRYDNGNASKHVHSLKEGDSLAIKGPISKFPFTSKLSLRSWYMMLNWLYKVNEFDEVALIGGGSGMYVYWPFYIHPFIHALLRTPLYQILDYALTDKNNKTKFKLIYANVTEKDILLRERFDQWKKQYPDKFDVVYVLEKADKSWNGMPLFFQYSSLYHTHGLKASKDTSPRR